MQARCCYLGGSLGCIGSSRLHFGNDVALGAQANKVIELVGLFVVTQTKQPEFSNMMNVELLSKFRFSDTAILAGVVVACSCLIACAVPTWSVIVDFAAIPPRIKRTASPIHSVLWAALRFAIALSRPVGFAYCGEPVTIKRAVCHSLLSAFALLFAPLFVVVPLKGDGARTVATLDSKVYEPFPKFVIAYTQSLGNLFNAKPLNAIQIVEQSKYRFAKLLLYLYLTATAQRLVAAFEATALVCQFRLNDFELLTAGYARLNRVVCSALIRAKLCSLSAFLATHVELLAASYASFIGHKRNLLSDGWHVCLGHAVPTGGIHNYIRLGANHQARMCPKQLHYSTGVRGAITA